LGVGMDRNVSSFGLAGCLPFERPGAMFKGGSEAFLFASRGCCRCGMGEEFMIRQGCGRQESRDVLEPRPKKDKSFVTWSLGVRKRGRQHKENK